MTHIPVEMTDPVETLEKHESGGTAMKK